MTPGHELTGNNSHHTAGGREGGRGYTAGGERVRECKEGERVRGQERRGGGR